MYTSTCAASPLVWRVILDIWKGYCVNGMVPKKTRKLHRPEEHCPGTCESVPTLTKRVPKNQQIRYTENPTASGILDFHKTCQDIPRLFSIKRSRKAATFTFRWRKPMVPLKGEKNTIATNQPNIWYVTVGEHHVYSLRVYFPSSFGGRSYRDSIFPDIQKPYFLGTWYPCMSAQGLFLISCRMGKHMIYTLKSTQETPASLCLQLQNLFLELYFARPASWLGLPPIPSKSPWLDLRAMEHCLFLDVFLWLN